MKVEDIPLTSGGRRMLESLRSRVLTLDGAMGTMIQRLGLREKDFRTGLADAPAIPLAGCNDLLCLTSPQNIRNIHRQYLNAGADIITTNTFNANALSLADYGLSDRAPELAEAGARLARKCIDEYPESKAFLAGSMGPSGVSLSLAARQPSTPSTSKPPYTASARLSPTAACVYPSGYPQPLLKTAACFPAKVSKLSSLP